MSAGPLAPRGGSTLVWSGPPLAGYRDRAEAALFDWIGPALATYLVQLPLLAFGRSVAVAGQALALVAALAWVVTNGVRQGRTGMSYGKRRVGIRLVDKTTFAVVGPGRSVVRWVARLVDLLPLFAGLVLPVFDPSRQTLADKFVGTVVLDGPTPAPIIR